MKNGTSLYFDHQATTPVDGKVFEEMLPYFTEQFGNPHSSDHAFGWRSLKAVDAAAAKVAALIGADPDEIVFTSGATEANNLALLGLAGRNPEKRRCRILSSGIEHKSVLAVLDALRDQMGYEVEHLPVDGSGYVSPEVLSEALDDTVLVVSVMAVNNEIGTIQDIGELSALAHTVGAHFHSDAAQAPLALNTTDWAQKADLLSLSSHKMYGPSGIGALYVRREIQDFIAPLILGGGQQHGLRSGTVPVPLCVGMGAAAELMQREEMAQARLKLRRLRDDFVDKVRSLPWPMSLNGPPLKDRHPGNANCCFHGFSAHDILDALQPKLAASTGSACTSGIVAPSHVLRGIGLSGDAAESSIRFSLGLATEEADVDAAVELLRHALERFSTTS